MKLMKGLIIALIFLSWFSPRGEVLASGTESISDIDYNLLTNLPTNVNDKAIIQLNDTEIFSVIEQDLTTLSELSTLKTEDKKKVEKFKEEKKHTIHVQVFEGIYNSSVVNKVFTGPNKIKNFEIPLNQKIKESFMNEKSFKVPYTLIISTPNSTGVYNFDQFYINDLEGLTYDKKLSIIQYIKYNNLNKSIKLNFNKNKYPYIPLLSYESSSNVSPSQTAIIDNSTELNNSSLSTESASTPIEDPFEKKEPLDEIPSETVVIEDASAAPEPELPSSEMPLPEEAGCIACVGYYPVSTVYEDKWVNVGQVHAIRGVDTTFTLSSSQSSTSSVQAKAVYKSGSVEVTGSTSLTYTSTQIFPKITGTSLTSYGKYAMTKIRFSRTLYRHPAGNEYVNIKASKYIGGQAWGNSVGGNGKSFYTVEGQNLLVGGSSIIEQTYSKTWTSAAGFSIYGVTVGVSNTMMSTRNNKWTFVGKSGYGYVAYKIYNNPTINNVTAR